MRRLYVTLFGLLVVITWVASASAKDYRFQYKLKAGDVWVAKDISQVRTEVMGTKSSTRTKRTIVYKVKRGPKRGWVTVEATIKSQASRTDNGPMNRGNSMAGMIFRVDMHKSGEIRNYKFSGGNSQTAQYIGPAMKVAMFGFPEFPADPLQVGDEFDAVLRMEMPGIKGTRGVQSITKFTYTLEDVSKGFAYFSVKQRTKIKASGMDIKDAGKGEAVFDIKEGMWIELETKSRSRVAAGIGSGGYTLRVSKMTMKKL
ncbi:hypothetical protein BMS3Abin07_02196 [bacterium BMS3Abin07]|nr:hypothetical protein BMS3Abin07_02196 [bacterium BMS3Abin07]HDZ88667.1 hypothetical protein [Nitrospirota bacterium]